MAENYTITEVPFSRVVNVQTLSPQDSNLLTQIPTEGYISFTGSNVEFSIYDLNNNLLFYNPNYTNWTTTETGVNPQTNELNSVSINPAQDIELAGYNYGQVYAAYNFLDNELGSSDDNRFFISEISSDRTEIRIDSTNISNESLEALFNDFYTKFSLTDTYDYFYLNFGNNNLLIATNLYLDKSTSDYSVLIKLYEALPQQFGLKASCFVSSIDADSVAYLLSFTTDLGNVDNIITLAGPNTNLDIKGQVNNSTTLQSYDSLTSTVNTSSFNQLKSLLEEKGVEINIDYTDYSNFVYFSSAKSRLENFYTKVKQIEDYNNEINALNLLTSTPGSSGSISLIEQYISNTISNFDGYEYYLYFETGSKAWPKTNTEPPFILASTGSTAAKTWYGSDIYGSTYYGGQLYSASLYDSENQDTLTNSIPDYLKDYNSENYLTFVKMIGQSFDSIWVYIKSISDKTNTDNRLEYGAPSGIIADILRSFGVKLYTNNFSVDNTYQSLLGIGADGQLYPTGSELINTLITASNLPLTLDDVQNLTYKKLYHNLPYLLKKKGTVDSIRTLANIFGVPDTILRINEFGGKDKNSNTWDYWQNEYDYAFNTSGSGFVNLKWDGEPVLNTDPGAVAAYSVRLLDSTYTGPLMRVRRSIDNEELEIYPDTLGNLDTSSIDNFCVGGDGYIVSWYDQSGNGLPLEQPDALLQPFIYFSGSVPTQNGKPTLYFNQSGYTQYLIGDNSLIPIVANSGSVFTAARMRDSNGSQTIWTLHSYHTTYYAWLRTNDIDRKLGGINLAKGTSMYNATNMKLSSVFFLDVSTNSYVNGVENTTSLSGGAYAQSSKFWVGSVIGAGSALQRGNMNISELILYDTDKSTTRTDIENSINYYYSIF